jgi:hypothetical protein
MNISANRRNYFHMPDLSRYRKSGDTDMTNQFLKKMENHATREATRLGESNHGKLRLIGTAIGIVVVVLVALWMAYHS